MDKRVVVVDDDDISRNGVAVILTGVPGLRLVAALTHEDAAGWGGRWRDADVVLVDAADERREGDQFPGVAVVEQVRRHRPRALVIVFTGHFFDGAVRRRMREAGADLFFHRGELAEAATLRAVVLGGTGRPVPGPEDPEEEIRHGVSRRSTVNAAVSHALAADLPGRLAERRNPRSRAWERLRREFNRHAGLHAMTCDGRAPDREQDLPSLPQIARFLRWATRVKSPYPGRPDGRG
ncbi:response regulator transcription factor [Microbispora sp. ATCC PTA-5024]|uniref:response regulator transcription factor n=1 Tax=Microbispora sp. ATCC PTA-5024 TaxID=316330 RepID=UPI0003DB6E95|nr:response regulator transcription factor [Microbispora sp. ATCC PTA-5024]ETK38127.1 hypothetical protein MPTA5024_00230 [Microbispora sp. ATCC PTA-5024]